MRRLVAALTGAVALTLAPPAADALDGDFDLSKLGPPETVTVDGVNGQTRTRERDPFAQERFARFATELALAIAPNPAAPMHSLGSADFDISFTADIAFVHPSQMFSDGQVRSVWPTIGAAPQALFLPTLRLRKGLPFSFEVGTDLSYLAGTTMAATGANVKWSLFEGFTYWPTVGIRGFGSVLVNSGPLLIIVGGWDVGGDYRFPVFGDAELTLYGGYQRIGVNASTGNIDFIPEHENELSAVSDDSVFQELPIGSPLSPTTGFHRVYFGLQLRRRGLLLGIDGSNGTGENLVSLTDRTRAQTDVWRLSARLGVKF